MRRCGARGAALGGVAALTLALAGCGAEYPDVFLLTRSGTIPGAKLSLLVNDGGTVSCNDGEPIQLPPELLLDAREIARELEEETHADLTLPAPPGSLLRFRLRTIEGTLSFSDADAARRPRLGAVVAFARTAAKDVCGLAR